MCRNLVAELSGLQDEDGNVLLCSRITKLRDLDLATNDDIIGSARRLATHRMTDNAARFKLRQQAIGLTWHPYTMLTDPELADIIRPVDQFMHDWMHGMVCSGVCNTTLHLMLEALRDNGHRDIYAMIGGFIRNFNWPSRVKSSRLDTPFDPSRREGNRKAGHFKCQASDMLSLYPVLAVYTTKLILPHAGCDAEALTFIALCDLMDLLTSVARGVVTPSALCRKVERFLDLFSDTFGVTSMHTKYHWLLHYALHLERYGTLVSCFVHERKHKTIKRFAQDILNTDTFEQSLLSEATCLHFHMLSDESVFDADLGLVSPSRAPPSVNALVAQHLGFDANTHIDVRQSHISRHSRFSTCNKNDVVLYEDGTLGAGVVLAHLDVEGDHLSVIRDFPFIRMEREHMSAIWRYSEKHIKLIYTDTIVDATIWDMVTDSTVRTILPTSYYIRCT